MKRIEDTLRLMAQLTHYMQTVAVRVQARLGVDSDVRPVSSASVPHGPGLSGSVPGGLESSLAAMITDFRVHVSR